jgi:hypothetical protein
MSCASNTEIGAGDENSSRPILDPVTKISSTAS